MNNVYACPESLIWTPDERQDANKRKCSICAAICHDIFARSYYEHPKRTDNFCSKRCWDKKESFDNKVFVAIKK